MSIELGLSPEDLTPPEKKGSGENPAVDTSVTSSQTSEQTTPDNSVQQPAATPVDQQQSQPGPEKTQTTETLLPPITQRDIARVIGAIQWTPAEETALKLGYQIEMTRFQEQVAMLTGTMSDRADVVSAVENLLGETTHGGTEYRHLSHITNADVRRKIQEALTQYIQTVGTETPARAENRPTADQRFLRSVTGEQLVRILENAQFDNGTHGAFDRLNVGNNQTELHRELADLATAINQVENRQEAAELIRAYFSEPETFAGFNQTVQEAMRDALIDHVENGRESGVRGLLSRAKEAWANNNPRELLRKGKEKVKNWWNKLPSWFRKDNNTPPETPDTAAPAAATAQEPPQAGPQETTPTYPEYPRTQAADRIYDHLEDFIAGPQQQAWNAIPEQQLRDFADQVAQRFQTGADQQMMQTYLNTLLSETDNTGAYVLFPTIGNTEVRENLQNEVLAALGSFDPFSPKEVHSFLLHTEFDEPELETEVENLPEAAIENLVTGIVEVFDKLDQGERSTSRMRTPIRYVRDNVALRRNLAPILAAVPMDEYMKTLLRAEIIEYYNRKVGQRNEAVRAAETPRSIRDTLGSIKAEYSQKGSAKLASLNAKKAEVAHNLDQRISTATRAARTKQVDSLSQKVGGEYAALSPENQAASVTPETVREIRGQLNEVKNKGESDAQVALAHQADALLSDIQKYNKNKNEVPAYLYRELIMTLNSLGLFVNEQGAVVEKDALSEEEAQEIVVEISRVRAEMELALLDAAQEMKLNPRGKERATKVKKWIARVAGFTSQAVIPALPEGSPLKMGLSMLFLAVPITVGGETVGYAFKHKKDGSRRKYLADFMDKYDGGPNASEADKARSLRAFWINGLFGIVMGRATVAVGSAAAESHMLGVLGDMVDNMMDWDVDLSSNVADGVDGAGVDVDVAVPDAEVPAADTPSYHDAINDGVKEITGGADRSFAEYKNTQLTHDLDQYANVNNLKMDHAQDIVSPLIGVDELTTPPENLEQYLAGVGDVFGVDMATVSTEDLATAIDDRFGGSTIQTEDVGSLFPTGMTDEQMQAYVDSNDGMSMDNGYITLTPEGLADLLDELRADVGMGGADAETHRVHLPHIVHGEHLPAEPTDEYQVLNQGEAGKDVQDVTIGTGKATDGQHPHTNADDPDILSKTNEPVAEAGATESDLESEDLLQPTEAVACTVDQLHDVAVERWYDTDWSANYAFEEGLGFEPGDCIKSSFVVDQFSYPGEYVVDLDLLNRWDVDVQAQVDAGLLTHVSGTPESGPDARYHMNIGRMGLTGAIEDLQGNWHEAWTNDANNVTGNQEHSVGRFVHLNEDHYQANIEQKVGPLDATAGPVEVPPPKRIGPDQATTDAVAQMTGDTQPETLNERVSREAANNRAAAAANSGEVTGQPITDIDSSDLLTPVNDPVDTSGNPTDNGRDAGGSATVLAQNPVARAEDTYQRLGPNAKWDENGVLIDPDIDGQERAAAEPPAEVPAPEMIAPEVAIDAGLDERGYSGAAKEGLKYYMTEIMGEPTVEEKFNTLFGGPNYGDHLAEMIDYVVDEDELTRSISDKILLNLADGNLEELTISGSVGETELFNGKMSVEAQKALLVELVSKAGEGYDGIAGQVSRLATGLPGESLPNFGYDATSVWGADGIKMEAITDEFAKLAGSGGEYSAEGVSAEAVKEVFEDIPDNVKDNPAAATPAQQAYYIMRLFGKFNI